MKRIFAILMLSAFLAAGTGAVFAANGHEEPAPQSGDGIADGSGFEKPNGPNNSSEGSKTPVGSAPNSGDGISDGSGFICAEFPFIGSCIEGL